MFSSIVPFCQCFLDGDGVDCPFTGAVGTKPTIEPAILDPTWYHDRSFYLAEFNNSSLLLYPESCRSFLHTKRPNGDLIIIIEAIGQVRLVVLVKIVFIVNVRTNSEK